MNITGVVRVDLGHLVSRGLLQVSESAAFEIWQAVGDSQHVCELDIGEAVDVQWTSRVVEALQDVARVQVVGSNSRGVAKAIRGLHQLVERGAA